MRLAPFGVLLAGILTLPAAAQDAQKPAGPASLAELLAAPVSTASRYEQRASEAPASVVVITAEEIERFGYTQVLEALEHEAGFFVGYDRSFGSLGLRGLLRPNDHNSRILLLIDGLPVNEAQWDGAALGSDFQIPLDAVERIEIARGTGSSVYGGNAMFAVVNVITRSASTVHGARFRTVGATYLGLGASGLVAREFGFGNELVVAAEAMTEEGEDFYWPELDRPDRNRGRAIGLDGTERRSVYARFRVGDLRLSWAALFRKKEEPTGAFGARLDEPSSTHQSRNTVAAAWTKRLANRFELDAKVALFRFHSHREFAFERLGGNWVQHVKGDWLHGGATAQWDAGAETRFLVGTDLRKDIRSLAHTHDDDSMYAMLDDPATRAGAFGQVERQLSRSLGLTAGLRYDWHSEGFSGLSPRAAVVYHPWENHTLKVLVGSAFRAPTMWEREYEDGVYVFTSPGVERERIVTAELWWEGLIVPSVWVQAAVYKYWLNDLIDEEFHEDEGMTTYGNIDDVSARGIELRLRGEVGAGLRWYVAGAVQNAHSEIHDEHGHEPNMTNSPARQLRVGLVGDLPGGAYVSGTAVVESGRLNGHDGRTDGFERIDAKLGFPAVLGGLGAEIAVKNVFDQRYLLPAGWQHAQGALPQPGRRMLIALTWGH